MDYGRCAVCGLFVTPIDQAKGGSWVMHQKCVDKFKRSWEKVEEE